MILAYNDGAGATSTSRAITGTGQTAASLSISDAGYNYGGVTVSTSASKTFTVTNSGQTAATLQTVSTAGLSLGTAYTWTGGTCATSGNIAASGGSCTLTVQFTPPAAIAYNTTIILGYFDGVNWTNAQRAITGTGLTVATLTISDAGYNYGNVIVGSWLDKTFTVTNSGQTSAFLNTISTAGLSLAAPYSWVGGTCATSGSVGGSGGSCTLTIRFSPSAASVYNSNIVLSYHDGVNWTNAQRAITGTGLTVATLTISDAGYNYGNVIVGSWLDKTFTVTNSGQTSAFLNTISTAGLSLAAPYSWVGGTCATSGSVGGSGGSCTLTIRFSPSAASVYNSNIVLSYHNGVIWTNAQRAITGTGLSSAVLAWNPGTNYDYGLQNVDVTQTFTLQNTGGATSTAITLSLTGGSPGIWEILGTGTCVSGMTNLAASGSCTVIVRFLAAASAKGSYTTNLRASAATGGTDDNGLQGIVGYTWTVYASYLVIDVTNGTSDPTGQPCATSNSNYWRQMAYSAAGTWTRYRREPGADLSSCPGNYAYSSMGNAGYDGYTNVCGNTTLSFPMNDGWGGFGCFNVDQAYVWANSSITPAPPALNTVGSCEVVNRYVVQWFKCQ